MPLLRAEPVQFLFIELCLSEIQKIYSRFHLIVARRLEYREKHPELSIPSTINEGGTAEYQNGKLI